MQREGEKKRKERKMRKVVWFRVWSDWCGAGLGAIIWMTWHLKSSLGTRFFLSITSSVLPIRKCQLSISLSNSQSFRIYFWDGSLVSFTSTSSTSLSAFYPQLYIYHLNPTTPIWIVKFRLPPCNQLLNYKIN